MSLYLCVFDGDVEVDGVDLGGYEDFDMFRGAVARFLEDGQAGSRFVTLMNHSDCDGEWDVAECERLSVELTAIGQAFRALPAVERLQGWQLDVAQNTSVYSHTLFDSFIDVDGVPVIESILRLCAVAKQKNRPILFQ
jgi:hypothetical protein